MRGVEGWVWERMGLDGRRRSRGAGCEECRGGGGGDVEGEGQDTSLAHC